MTFLIILTKYFYCIFKKHHYTLHIFVVCRPRVQCWYLYQTEVANFFLPTLQLCGHQDN